LEYPIPVLEAEALMNLRVGTTIEKVRYEVRYKDLVWEIDVFDGENSGLIIAEVELKDEHQEFNRPDWIGEEITGQWQYYNGALVERPFRLWSTEKPAPRRRPLANAETLAR
jgi:adenylate cyclase